MDVLTNKVYKQEDYSDNPQQSYTSYNHPYRPVHNMTVAQRSFHYVSYRFSEAVHNLSLATIGYSGARCQLNIAQSWLLPRADAHFACSNGATVEYEEEVASSRLVPASS